MNLILNHGPERGHFPEQDFPLALGLTKTGSLVAGAAAEPQPIIWILLHHGRYSVQPEKSRAQVFHNDGPLTEPKWLEPGDEIALGHHTLEVAIGPEGLSLTSKSASEEAVSGAGAPAAPGDGGQSENFGKPLAPTKALLERARNKGLFGLTRATKIIASVFTLLSLGVGYVLVASAVYVRVSPAPQFLSVSGFPPPIPIFDRYLVLPGDYIVEARAPGYRVLKAQISVAFREAPSFEFKLRKLPGLLSLTTPPIAGARILIDGQEKGSSPLKNLEVEAGQREIRVVSRRYLPEIRKLDIQGKGQPQAVEIRLRPGWGTLSVASVPAKAQVKMNGREVGETPITFEPLQGSYKLELMKDGWKPVTRRIDVRAGVVTNLATIGLEKIDGTLQIQSDPPGAVISIGGTFRGRTPAALPLVSGRAYHLKLSKQGYTAVSRTAQIEGGKTTALSIRLKPELGTIFLTTNPPGATLAVNGRPAGSATQRLRLQTVPQSLRITKPGYLPFKQTVLPRRGVPKNIKVTLKTAGEALRERAKKGIPTPGGQILRLIHIGAPVRFRVGGSRRESGRRSNEVQYPVVLTRSFLISEKEVTNAEFRRFLPRHSSKSHQGISLDDPDQPAVNLSWADAARYANWLSKKEGLEPAYREDQGKVVPVVPLTNGYRLPTEAEWDFVSRYDGGRQPPDKPHRFPWGAHMPPPKNSGNYADDGALRQAFSIPGYVDGFPVSAPVGKFAPNGSGVYDLGGNVSEWCHDFYDVPSDNIREPLRDPSGPREGRFHVVKGASWRSGSLTELRLSYRDYALKPRNDIGFRIVRNVGNAAKN
jgi:formylglycine-generating enzyme required for sulfatase activity